MKIALDLHGTIDQCPLYFNSLLDEWKNMRHEAWVMSGPPKKIIQKELDTLGIKNYYGIISVVEFLKDLGVEMWQRPDNKRPNDWWVGSSRQRLGSSGWWLGSSMWWLSSSRRR